MDLLNLTWYMPQGSRGTDDDPSNPLSRAVNRLFEDGQPFVGITLCFFGDLHRAMQHWYTQPIETLIRLALRRLPLANRVWSKLRLSSIRNSPLRWLGAFIFSAGERVIFFPGFALSPPGVQSFQGQSAQRLYDYPALMVDHVTLDPDRTWHFTTHKSEAHIPPRRERRRLRACPLGDERFLWFGMSVARETELRELKADTIVTAYTPPRDTRRRADVFHRAQDGATYPCVRLLPEARMRFQEGFLHFACIAGPRGFPDYQGRQLGIPFGSPFLFRPIPNPLEQLSARAHRLSLGSKIDIQLVSMWLPGALRVPFSFTGF
jgi:hypothetical protein